MIDPNETYQVTRIEYHCLSQCGCLDCQQERERRIRLESLPPSSVRSLTPYQAFVLGYISHLSSAGSVARELLSRRIDPVQGP